MRSILTGLRFDCPVCDFSLNSYYIEGEFHIIVRKHLLTHFTKKEIEELNKTWLGDKKDRIIEGVKTPQPREV